MKIMSSLQGQAGRRKRIDGACAHLRSPCARRRRGARPQRHWCSSSRCHRGGRGSWSFQRIPLGAARRWRRDRASPFERRESRKHREDRSRPASARSHSHGPWPCRCSTSAEPMSPRRRSPEFCRTCSRSSGEEVLVAPHALAPIFEQVAHGGLRRNCRAPTVWVRNFVVFGTCRSASNRAQTLRIEFDLDVGVRSIARSKCPACREPSRCTVRDCSTRPASA